MRMNKNTPEIRKYLCQTCKKSFKTKSYMRIHQKYIHGALRAFSCDICNQTFHIKSAQLSHMRNHSDDKKHICSKCPKGFVTNGELILHSSVHTTEKRFDCGTCGKKFKRLQAKKFHFKFHHTDPSQSMSCNLCCKTFTASRALKSHKKVHSGQRPFACKDCKKFFPTSGGLRRHRTSHLVSRPFICSVCDKPFKSNESLKTHLLIHSEEKNFSCSSCKTVFTSRSGMQYCQKKHERKSMGLFSKMKKKEDNQSQSAKEKELNCHTCAKKFNSVDKLRAHVFSMHTVENSANCNICGDQIGESKLSSHQKAHFLKKHPICSRCNKVFTTTGGLKMHMRVHTGERPFSCLTCKRSFSLSSD